MKSIKQWFCSICLIIAMILAASTGCGAVPGKTAESTVKAGSNQIVYEQNDTVLTFDELMLWATDQAQIMASKQAKDANEQQDGTVLVEYGYSEILFSSAESPKILRFEMKEANNTCPRGVNVGNPLEKVLAYYKSSENPDLSQNSSIYFEETVTETVEKYNFGCYRDGHVLYGAVGKEVGEDTFRSLLLDFETKEGIVSNILFTAEYGISKEDAQKQVEQYRTVA